MSKDIARLISASKTQFEKMSPSDIKRSIEKSEGRVLMGRHCLIPAMGEGLVAHVTNAEVMFAMGADIHVIGDGGFCGMPSPENIHQMSVTLKGRQYTYFRMASTNR